MKRSTCLSALLVGLSLTIGVSALAAPPPSGRAPKKSVKKPAAEEEKKDNKAKAPPTDVAQAQPTDPPPPQPEGGGTAPTPAPADPTPPAAEPTPASEPSTQPAVTLGTSTSPASDQPQAAAEEPKAKPKPRAWAGTSIFMSTSTSTATIFKDQQQDYNPTVDSNIYFLPRYAINEAFQLRGRLIFTYEWTNSDETVTKHEPRFSDTTLQLFYRKIPEVAGIKPMVALNAGLPTSPESRARTLVFTPGATLQLSKGVEHVAGGELLFLASAVYSHPIYRNTTPEVRTARPYAFQCVGGNACTDQLSGTFNPSDSISYAFLASGEWGKWNPAIYYLGSSQWAYTGRSLTANDVQPGLGNQPIGSSTAQGPTNVRQLHYFSAWLDYNWNSWFTSEVGYWLQRSALTEDGKYGNPFFDKYQDMRVYIGASFQVDNLIKQLEGGSAEAGIVRAKNNKTPMWTF
jgi:hypothetical protein